MPNIWRLAHQRAVRRCKEQLELSLGAAATTFIVAAIYLLLVWNFVGTKEGRQEFELRLALSAAPVLGFPLLYFVQFFLSPRKIYDEAQSQIQELSERLDRKPRLKLSFASDRTVKLPDGIMLTFLRATNEKDSVVEAVEVKIEEFVLKRSGSETWEKTSIIARPNMSWCSRPDFHPQKYATIQLAAGGEILDFVSGPYAPDEKEPGFLVRVDPAHRGINPYFTAIGTYRFVAQASASDAEKPEYVTLFVNWDGKKLSVWSDEPGQVLATAELSSS